MIGRFLEHSRIFYFAAGSDDPLDGDFFIGSADWTYRNLSRRVEVAAPVTAREARARLWEILEVLLGDQRQARQMNSDGAYVQLRPPAGAEGRTGAGGTHPTLIARSQSRLTEPCRHCGLSVGASPAARPSGVKVQRALYAAPSD